MERHDGIGYDLAQNLDVPVLHMVEQLPDVLQFFATCLPVVAEQVIDVPKILPHDVPLRRLCRETQLAEQLVEVPTVLSYSSLQQLIVEQTVDIPVPGRAGGGERGGLQGFSGQGSTASCGADRVDIPVPRSGGLQGSRPGQRSSSWSRLLQNTDAGIQRVFRTFPQGKKSAGLGPHSGSELGPDFNPWTPAAHAESMAGACGESEAESESEADVEEGAATRFAAGFRPLRVCTRFLEHQLGRPVWECAYGDRCTFAHSWAELHPEASAHEQQLASYFPD